MEGLIALILGVLLFWLAIVGLLVLAGRRVLARELALLIPNVLRLFHGLLRDPRVPLRYKMLLGAGVAYLALPIDIVPDFIPVAGSLDDAIITALILAVVVRGVGREVVVSHWRGGAATLDLILR